MSVRILLLEDSEDDVILLQSRIAQDGLDATWLVAADGPTFRAHLESGAFDLALLDYCLPGLDGLEALSLLRQAHPDCSAIIVSGQVGEEVAAEVMRAGADDIILKDRLSRLVPAIRRELKEAAHRQAERDAQTELRLLQQAIGQSPDAVLITDPEGILIYVNPAVEAQSGYSRRELLGQKPSLFKSGRHDAAFYASMWTTVLKGEVWRGTIINRRKDGGLWEQQAALSPVFDAAGRLTQIVSTARDVTHERELQERLNQSQRLETLGVLTSGISHDFNNILTPILAHAELGLRREPGDPRTRADLETIRVAAERAAVLVRQVLRLSRPGGAVKTDLDLVPLLKECLKLVRSALPSSIAIVQEIEEPRLAVWCEPTQFYQVLLNLCTNAGHAMRGMAGTLRVVLRRRSLAGLACVQEVSLPPGEYVELAVEDNGRGIAKEDLDKLFLPFFTTKTPAEGTGLGLSIVHGLVSDMKGGIQVESTPGEGSVFRVYLPSSEAIAGLEAGDPQFPVPEGKERIMLLDDEEPIAQGLAIGLRALGYKVSSFSHPAEALAVLRAAPFSVDAVILDFSMPGMNGVEFLDLAFGLRPGLPAILMSGWMGLVDEKQARAAGFQAFLQKPITAAQLARALRSTLESKQRPTRDW